MVNENDKLTYIFDLDGVIYRGMEPQPHSAELIRVLKDRGHQVRYFTNNSALSRTTYSTKLTGMGIPTPVEEIMTSAYATALYFADLKASGKTVFRVGGAGLGEELEAVGMNVISNYDDDEADIDFVVVGLDRAFNYDKLAYAQRAILKGAGFIATNCDPTFPMESGTLLPGGGTMVAALKTCTDIEPFVVGKPELYAFNKILELTNTSADHAVMVGDRLDTDVLVGNRAGSQAILVLTGVSTRAEAEQAKGDYIPTRVIDTLGELI